MVFQESCIESSTSILTTFVGPYLYMASKILKPGMFYHLSIFFCLDSRLILEPPGLPRHGGQYEWVRRRHQFLGRAAGPPNRSSIVAWSLRSDLWKGLAHVWSQELAWGVMICDACDVFFARRFTVFWPQLKQQVENSMAHVVSWLVGFYFLWMDRCESLSLFVCTAYLGYLLQNPLI